MSTNCLVTKLKGVVDNDNLRKLGIIELHVNALEDTNPNYRTCVILPTGGEITLTSKGTNGEGFTINNTHYTSYTIANGVYCKFIVDNADFNIELGNKYCLQRIFLGEDDSGSVIDVPVVDIMCPELMGLITRGYDDQRGGLVGDVTKLNAPKINEFVISGSKKATGNVGNLVFNDLKALYMTGCPNVYGDIYMSSNIVEQVYTNNNYNLTGSIFDFKQCLTLRVFSAPGTNIDTTDATLEQFAQAQFDSGRNSGTVTVITQNNTSKKITYSTDGYVIN